MASIQNTSASSLLSGASKTSQKEAGMEPVLGYRLLEPLGRGGFGEVWKCEAPGGIHKAIKFVRGNASQPTNQHQQAAQEYKSLKRIVTIRHPFILSMDRIEESNGELMIVMELADRTLHDLLEQYRKNDFAGIPREELLTYLAEAAEALDHMNQQHGLMHLDIKPGNLFLISNHVKVADFGLVTDLGTFATGSQTATQAAAELTGITPLYVAPETLQGKIHPNSDQYSLAIVYQEMLTGTLPFNGKNPRQLAMQHMMAEPNLQAVPPRDLAILTKALSKDPAQRYASCLAFIHALIFGDVNGPAGSTDLKSARMIRKLQGVETAGEISLASTDFSGRDHLTLVQPARPMSKSELNISSIPPSSVPPPSVPRMGQNRPVQIPKALSGAMPSASSNDEMLPGFQFEECIGRSPIGELWRVRSPDGEQGLAKVVTGFDGMNMDEEQKAIGFLRSLKHQGLIPTEIIHNDFGRLAVLMPNIQESLWDRFQAYRAQRLSGIPRDDLLAGLRQCAYTLDDLYQRFETLHLGLNPRNLMVTEDGDVLIVDFGLIHTLWVPTGQSLGNLNSRYSAPELAEGVIHRSSDIYSLALIYQEMVVGVHPLRAQSGRVAGRPSMTPNLARSTNTRKQTPDLDALHPAERKVMEKAFDNIPEHRYQSCLEFIDALEQAGSGRSTIVGGSSTNAARVAAEQQASPSSGTYSWQDINIQLGNNQGNGGPTASQAIGEIVGTIVSAWPTETFNSIRYVHRRGELIHHRCGAMLVSGLAQTKLDGFRLAIGAELVRVEDSVYVYRVSRPQKSFWKSLKNQQQGLEVTLHLVRPPLRQALLTDVTVQIKPYGIIGDEAVEMLREGGPRVIETLRNFLQATPDRRAHERYEYNVPFKVYPLSPRGETGPGINCNGKDISLGGVSFYSPSSVRVNTLRVDIIHPGRGTPVPVDIMVIRCDACSDGRWYEVGGRFIFDQNAMNR